MNLFGTGKGGGGGATSGLNDEVRAGAEDNEGCGGDAGPLDEDSLEPGEILDDSGDLWATAQPDDHNSPLHQENAYLL